MSKRLVVTLVSLATLFVLAIGWLGFKLTVGEAERLRTERNSVLDARLSSISATAAEVLFGLERDLSIKLQSVTPSAEPLRALVFDESYLQRAFVIDAKQRLAYPRGAADESERETELRQMVEPLVQRQVLVRSQPEVTTPTKNAKLTVTHAWWHAAHWRDGLHLFLLQATGDGSTIGVEVNRPRILADILVAFSTVQEPPPFGSFIEFITDDGTVLNTWGKPSEAVATRRELSLAPPLQSFRLRASLGPTPLGMRSTYFNVLAGVLLLGVSTALLGLFAFREYRRELREAATRVTFVGKVSHELRTPLTSVRLYAALLEERIDADDEVAKRYLATITRESERLSRLIGNILRLGELDSGKLSIKRQPTDLPALLKTVVDLYQPLMATHGMTVTTEFPSACSPRLLDQDSVTQIVHNLLSNAEKYARTGTVILTLSERADRVTLEVSDQGPGIPAELREKVFEPFFRVSNALTDGVTGTGIGLGISRELARLHGGDLQIVEPASQGANSHSQSGLTLCLTLEAPVARINSESTAEQGET